MTVVPQIIFYILFENAQRPVIKEAGKPLLGPGWVSLDVQGFTSLQLKLEINK